MKPTGFVRLNAPEGPVPADATIIVSGPPRGGTSLAAAALCAAGLWLGDMIDHAVFEDVEIADALNRRWPATRDIDWPRLRALDSRTLTALVASRNAATQRWGFKQPDISAPLVMRSGRALFRNPRLVMMFRDPVGLAERIAIAESIDVTAALRLARLCNASNLKTARQALVPVLLASYDKAILNQAAFYDELFAFCGLAVDPADYPRIDAFVAESGDKYLKTASAPVAGFVNRFADGRLYGWCRLPGVAAQQCVDIAADGVLVATTKADVFRRGLKQAGIGRGRHAFEAPLAHLSLPDTTVLRVTVHGTRTELANSGRTLADYKAASSGTVLK